MIKFSFKDISEILLRKDTKTTPDFDYHWKKVNNLNLSRISSSRFNDIEYLTPIKDIFFKSEDNLNNLDDLDVLNVTDLVEIEDEKFEEVN